VEKIIIYPEKTYRSHSVGKMEIFLMFRKVEHVCAAKDQRPVG
jgi:hypothetical protein